MTLFLVVPSLALTACNSSREEELAQQLAEAKAKAAEEAAARKAAERDAATLRARARDAALADFYANGDGKDDAAVSPVEARPAAEAATLPDAPAGVDTPLAGARVAGMPPPGG
ncbi:hypothetical protein [Novosphingobium malaysiense]|uniref:hypothetical protein n=1 Tax=Novosphingobium malaysiense TaxID=1348853 RepID=UPI000A89B921|nr:hypothetical protein [Novosphingobium malaysiense]